MLVIFSDKVVNRQPLNQCHQNRDCLSLDYKRLSIDHDDLAGYRYSDSSVDASIQ